MPVKVTMYLDHIRIVVGEAKKVGMAALAMACAAQTQANIRSNDQIDTGFMVNSVYAIAEGGIKGASPGGPVNSNQVLAPAPPVGADEAAVVVGANYAIYQELMQPFLYPAAETIAGQVGAVAEKVMREVIHD